VPGEQQQHLRLRPDPQTGAGKAGGNTTGLPGSPTNQYVNFGEFGRCLDVPAVNVNLGYLISYPCKQAPNSATLTWNQVWRWTAVSGTRGRLSTNVGNTGNLHCLTAPATGVLVTVTPCSTGQASQDWIATGNSPSGVASPYALLSTTRNECLSLDANLNTSYGASKAVLEPCDGRPVQRWNAPPMLAPAGLADRKEGSVER
jgi:hypothetical protein